MEALTPEDPRTLGAYRLLARLGSGGMGRVYLARSDRGRTVAVKLVHPELATREEFRSRFRQEVRSALRVGGEWTAPVLDADTGAAVPWVATGYIAGPSLRQVVGQDFGPLPERSVRILGAGLARALQAVHAAGIVHRDLKPSNVLITLDGPRVIDFGIARALGGGTTHVFRTMGDVTDGGLTRTGAAVGSPGFMSPEQVRGAQVTPASDVFCLGSVLAYAATGRMPFGTADSGVHALMYRIAEEQPDLAAVPEALRPLIAAFLAKDPAARPTPEEALERTGAAGLLTDLRSAEPWLPGGLVAQLGRHAVQLLDVEDPSAAAPAPGASIPAEPPTRVVTPADPPTATAPPAPGYGYGYPPPPPPPRSKTPYLLAAIVVAGLLAGGGTVCLLRHRQSGNGTGPAASSTAPPATAPATTPPAAPGTVGPSPAVPPATGPAAAGGAQAYAGTWQSGFDSGGGRNTRVLTIRPGAGGTGTAEIRGGGYLDDGTAYTCAWTASVSGSGDGTPLHLGPSTVVRAQPASACRPGSPSDLVLLPDGRLRRDFTDSGTKDASLVYSRTG